MARITVLAVFVAWAGTGLQAQSTGASGSIPFDIGHVTDAARLKQALAAIKDADAWADKGGVDHDKAMDAYRQAFAINPDNAELNLKMGICLLNGPAPSTALEHLQRAAELDPGLPRVQFLLGYALQLNARWEEAVACFRRHQERLRSTPDPDRTYYLVDKHIHECNSGMALMREPSAALVTGAGQGINTAGSEYGALLDGNGNLYFTSRRPETTGGKINKVNNNWYEDIFHSTWTANGWSDPVPASGGLNSMHNDATVALSGENMIVYRDERNGGDLFACKRTATGWAAPVPLPATVNSKAQESSAWPTADGKWLYFVSRCGGGQGGGDIYRCPWNDALGTWGMAENLGPDINTGYDEEGVFVTADGSALYFASEGHNSMGGYDLFKCTRTASHWSKPVNLGWPVNSPGDDQFLVLTADGRSGYFNSVRPGGVGEDDIYRVDFPAAAGTGQVAMLASAGGGAPVMDQAMVRLIGFVKGLKMMQPMEATVELMGLDDPAFQTAIRVDGTTGRFEAEVPAGKPYAMHVKADGYLLHSEHVAGPAGAAEINVDLKPVTAGNAEVMRNIFFDHDTYQLDTASMVELQALAEFLKLHSAIRVEIGGYTDSDIGPVPNQELSDLRAQAVVDWLVAHGIAPGRLEAKGYGAADPVAPNDTRANKALNRRTEIRVL
ncbi:MAG: OmpA family protein [Flavobacteriales bacterium]|nr:OmpA family protein [Flavobacteriales bacterium]